MNNNDQIVTTLPSVKEMVQNGYTTKHWLQYFINVWNRQAAACAIDIKCDQIRKAINPEMEVEDQQQIIPVKQRLENRKLKLQDYLDIIAGAKELMAIPDDQIEEALFSEKALAVDADMIELPVKTDEDVEKEVVLEPEAVPEAVEETPEIKEVEPVNEEEAK